MREIAAGVVLTCAALSGAALVAAPTASGQTASVPQPRSLYADVDTSIGTDEGATDFGSGGGAGATFPGAAAPFGMVQLSPDTDPSLGNFAGGYTYSDSKIKGFSLTHLSGAGCAALGDFPLLPTTNPVTVSPATLGSFDLNPRYVASFTHRNEVARPADYRVTLNPASTRPIRVETTALDRAGLMRVSFPDTGSRTVLLNAGGSSMGNFFANVHVDPERHEVSGTVTSGTFCQNSNRYQLHVVVRFDQPFRSYGTWTKVLTAPGSRSAADRATLPQVGVVGLQYKRIPGGPQALPGNPSSGAQAGAYLTFGAREVVARVALSSVDLVGARRNLTTSAPRDRSFDQLRGTATGTWRHTLDAVLVGGGSTEHRKTFATALYHSLLMPTTVSDVDGRYRGLDGEVHEARGFVKYSNISGWDAYRAQVPLISMLAPRRARDLAHSLVADWHDSGQLPKWPLLEGHTDVMVGDPADLILAGIKAFGQPVPSSALKAMVAGATTEPTSRYVQRPGLADYLAKGYVGSEQNTDVLGHTIDPHRVWGSVATTLEYAAADFAIAQTAAATGDTTTCRAFRTRSANWRHVFNPTTRSFQLRSAQTGSWTGSGDPASDDGFVEGSASQYTWGVPQDVTGLIRALGGRAATRERLDAFFTRLNSGIDAETAFLGNEPNLHAPALYNWVGAPAAGQAVTRRAMLELWSPTPGGMPGNDDGGALSAWWVWNAIGLYPAIPGTNILTFTTPLFPRAVIRVPAGTLQVVAPLATPGNDTIGGVSLDGRSITRTWTTFRQLTRGGDLQVVAAPGPGGNPWGTGPGSAPPSYGADAPC